MALGLGSSLVKGGASLLTYVKDNLKLYLDFKSSRSDTLAFPSEGSTSFDGNDDYIETSDSADFDFGTGDFSISFWFNVDDINWNWAVSRANSANSNDVYRGGTNNGGKLIFRDIVGSSDIIGSTTISANVWNHYTAVRNNGILKLYLNGVEDASASSGGNFDSDKGFRIGRWQSSGDYWDGQLANVAVWSRALEPEEVQSIMNKSYSQLKGVEKTSLVSWWALDTAPDTLGNNLITNGTFDSDLSSWSTSSSHWKWNNGRAYAYSGSNYQFRTSSVISWTTGATYNVSFDIEWVSGSSLSFYLDGTLITITSDTTSVNQNVVHTSGAGYFQIYNNGSVVYIDNIVVKELKIKDSESTNHGSVTGATTTTSVYGGNAPILPRAVDVAKEGQADAIGNGSASFVGSNTDYIVIENGKSPSYPFTLTAWVYPEIFNSHGTIYNAWVNESLWWGVYSHVSLGKVRLHLVGGNDYIDTPNGSLPVNEWSHIATTWDGTNAKTYINGIAQTMILTGALAMPTAEGPPVIGMLSTNLSSNPYTGDIAQLGIFAGALTQAQIQSVMESTSYSKIPADVKSTLGVSEITDDSDKSYVGVSSNNWEVIDTNNVSKSFSNDQMVFTLSATPSAVAKLNIDDFEGDAGIPQKFLKVTIDVDSTTTGTYRINNSGGSCTVDRFRTDLTTGLNTIYAECDGANSYFSLIDASAGAGDKLVINSFDVKEVTNDIVAYYPLDGSSSANGVTQDVTTGETLGADQVTNGTFDIDANWTTGTGWDIENGVAICDGTQTGNTELKQQGIILGANLDFEVGKTYKVTFDVTVTAGAITYVEVGGGSDHNDISTTQDNVIRYITATSTNDRLTIAGNLNFEGTVDNVVVKEVTSNTGVLK
jgi:hypothetical protein